MAKKKSAPKDFKTKNDSPEVGFQTYECLTCNRKDFGSESEFMTHICEHLSETKIPAPQFSLEEGIAAAQRRPKPYRPFIERQNFPTAEYDFSSGQVIREAHMPHQIHIANAETLYPEMRQPKYESWEVLDKHLAGEEYSRGQRVKDFLLCIGACVGIVLLFTLFLMAITNNQALKYLP